MNDFQAVLGVNYGCMGVTSFVYFITIFPEVKVFHNVHFFILYFSFIDK